MKISAKFNLYRGSSDPEEFRELQDSFDVIIESVEEYQEFVNRVLKLALESKE